VADLCDRLAVVHAGRLRFAGTPGELTGRTGTPNLEQAFLATIAD
jgi:ABC-2 type transport system ATP-binding protein